MGLSKDPEARQRQLDALARGRRTLAERWLADAEPGPSPGGGAPAAAGASTGDVFDYDEPVAERRPEGDSDGGHEPAGGAADDDGGAPGGEPAGEPAGGGALSRFAEGLLGG